MLVQVQDGVMHSPGQKQDAAVHVDEVAEGVNVGAGHAAPSTVVQGDAGRQGQRHQQVGHGQIHGVNNRRRRVGGGPAEHVESQTVQHHANHQHQTVTRLQQGGMDGFSALLKSGSVLLTATLP